MKRTFNLLLALLGWFAIIDQFLLMLENRTTSVPEMIIRFFSFFTILTNIIVAFYFTNQFFTSKKTSESLFNKAGSLTAITIYITVVGLVYQIALRHLWKPTGLQRIIDELLHTVIPTLVIIYWFFYEQKLKLKWKMIPKFLLYPLFYLGYILLRGKFSDFYPYPFINVTELGWPQIGINILVLFSVFLILSILFVGIGKLVSKNKT
ncbi:MULTISPECIES: Pr6Pr family membrane protein [Flavobacterium]|uniref:Pr6Pr family membrane protein n=1 Tax=Flavobacterium hankyongi TaxID=1176532 RepID=A0ABP8ZHT7_9FLAO|nr:Pr6Pr family membrane protein [Flavobacterium sp. N1846]